MKVPLPRSFGLGILAAAWLVLVAAGMSQLCRYETRPGEAGNPVQKDPLERHAVVKDRRLHLVMVVHPQCPCTRASLDELGLLMARSQTRICATVIFVQYAETSGRWKRGDLWRQAAAIPGVAVVRDPNGKLARRLGARTSGETYLYDDRKRLLFAGGLTGARGQIGENAGYDCALFP